MLWKPRRTSRAGRSALRTGMIGRASLKGASLLLVASLAFLAGGCGFRVQTSQPYTPGEGVAVDVGDPANPNKVVHVRNLSIISWAPGEGVVSAAGEFTACATCQTTVLPTVPTSSLRRDSSNSPDMSG